MSTSACGSSTGVCSWGCPGGLGFGPVRARCGSGAVAWVSGVLAAPGTQGSWRPEQQEIQCSRMVWQPVLANTLQCSCLENPPDREAWQATVYRIGRSWTQLKRPCMHRHKIFFFLPVAALPQWELSMEVVQLLGFWGPWGHWACRDTDCLCCRSYGSLRVFFQAFFSWRSEGLFGQSFSVVPPVQALRGLPCLGSFSAVWHIRHIEGLPLAGQHQALQGAPWVGSNSVVQCIRCLMGQPLYCSAADPGIRGERGCGDGSTPYAWLSSIALLPSLLGFPSQAFPTAISSLTSLQSVSLQSTAALTLGLLLNC